MNRLSDYFVRTYQSCDDYSRSYACGFKHGRETGLADGYVKGLWTGALMALALAVLITLVVCLWR